MTMDDVRVREIAGENINPCPICGKKDEVYITTKHGFSKRRKLAVHIECDRCDLELWSFCCDSIKYYDHRHYIIKIWNSLIRTAPVNDEELQIKPLDEDCLPEYVDANGLKKYFCDLYEANQSEAEDCVLNLPKIYMAIDNYCEKVKWRKS